MFLCITILKLILNETMLVVDIIKPLVVSRLLFKNKETNYMIFAYRLHAGTWTNAMGWQYFGPGLIAQIHIHPRSRDVAGAAYEDCPKTVFTTPKEFCNFSIVIGGLGTFSHTSLEKQTDTGESLAFYLGVWGLGSRKFWILKALRYYFLCQHGLNWVISTFCDNTLAKP